jgi:hypothetical protein
MSDLIHSVERGDFRRLLFSTPIDSDKMRTTTPQFFSFVYWSD